MRVHSSPSPRFEHETTAHQSWFLASGIAVLQFPALSAGIESGVYHTKLGATAEEIGDRVENDRRVIPISATLTFDLSATPPTLTAQLPNAELEGRELFPLTVRSSSGGKLPDGTYVFSGDYLADIYPSGTQYLFDWKFSAQQDSQLLWNGATYWAGGHIWQINLSSITILPGPLPLLEISRVGSEVRISWPLTYIDYVLEQFLTQWRAVSSQRTVAGDRITVTVQTEDPLALFRLREP